MTRCGAGAIVVLVVAVAAGAGIAGVVVGRATAPPEPPTSVVAPEPPPAPVASLPDASESDGDEYRRAYTVRAERAPTHDKTCLSARGRYRLNLAAGQEAAEARLYRDNGSGDLGTMELLRYLTATPRTVVSGRPFDLPDGCYQLAVSPRASAWLTRRVPTPATEDDPTPTPTAVPTVADADLEPAAEQRTATGDLTSLVTDPDQPSYTATEQTIRLCLTRPARYRLQAVAATGGPVQQPAQRTVTLTRVERPAHDGRWPTGQRVARLVAGGRPSDHRLIAGCYELAARRGAIGTLRRTTAPSNPKPPPWRTAQTTQRFVGCSSSQKVVKLISAYEMTVELLGAERTNRAMNDPATVAEYGCRWLDAHDHVRVLRHPARTVVLQGAGTGGERRHLPLSIVQRCGGDRTCTAIAETAPQWFFPTAMLRIDP